MVGPNVTHVYFIVTTVNVELSKCKVFKDFSVLNIFSL